MIKPESLNFLTLRIQDLTPGAPILARREYFLHINEIHLHRGLDFLALSVDFLTRSEDFLTSRSVIATFGEDQQAHGQKVHHKAEVANGRHEESRVLEEARDRLSWRVGGNLLRLG